MGPLELPAALLQRRRFVSQLIEVRLRVRKQHLKRPVRKLQQSPLAAWRDYIRSVYEIRRCHKHAHSIRLFVMVLSGGWPTFNAGFLSRLYKHIPPQLTSDA